jgi:cephalosporin-C deacetylase
MIAGLLGRVAHVLTAIVLRRPFLARGQLNDVARRVYLVSRPDVDAKRLGAMGTSQGGGMVLAVASLDPRIGSVVAHVPFLCDMRSAARMEGALVRRLLVKYDALTPAHLRTLDYFDPANLARRLKAPALLSAGGKDGVCPPSTVRAVFDKAAGVKSLVVYPDLPHTTSGDFYKMGWEWLGRHLAE